MLSSPSGPSFHLPRPDRGADSSFSVASGMLTSHRDGTRVRWSSPRQGGRTADARETTNTRLSAAEMVGTGLQSRRVERAEGTDPFPDPEDVTKHNDGRPTPGSEVQPHPRTGQGRLRGSCGKTWNPGVVRGQALFLNLFPCEAGTTWFSAGDGRVHLLPDLDLISGPPLIAARPPAAFPPGSAQSAEPDPLHHCVFGWKPRCSVEFLPFCSLTQIRLSRRYAGVRESEVSSQGMNFLAFREIIGVTGRDDVGPR